MAVNGVTVIALEWGIFVPLATVFVLIRFIVRYLYPSKFTTIGNLLVALAFALFLLAPSLDTVTWQAGFYSDNAALETPVSSDSTVYGLKVCCHYRIPFHHHLEHSQTLAFSEHANGQLDFVFLCRLDCQCIICRCSRLPSQIFYMHSLWLGSSAP